MEDGYRSGAGCGAEAGALASPFRGSPHSGRWPPDRAMHIARAAATRETWPILPAGNSAAMTATGSSARTLTLLVLLAAPGASAQPAGGPTGSWICQSSAGTSQLEFRNAKVLVFDGEQRSYRILGSAIQVIEDGLPVNYGFTLKGERLDILSPDGEPIRCARAGGGSQAAGAAPAQEAAKGNHNHLLQGMLCLWSGSSPSSGSCSSTQKVWFDGRGRFGTGSESSFGTRHNDAGGDQTGATVGYGSGEGEGGAYEVTSPAVGAPIRVRWDNGETDMATVHFVSGGRITEIKYGKKEFGAALCQ
jgi:hypothetical protein